MYLKLRFEISKNGYSIKMFSEEIEMSEKTLRNKINGKTDFTWSECLLIRKVLNTQLPLEELFEKNCLNTN